MDARGGEMTQRREDETASTGADASGPGFDEFEGGDAACWLQYVCDECGALVEGSTATPCWRCGATRTP
jgi:rubrerythrin